MQKKKTQQSTLAISLLFLMVSSVSVVYADGFYTIIGPDGRPMVVPMKVVKKEPELNKQKQQINTEKVSQQVIKHADTTESITTPLEQQKVDHLQPLVPKPNPENTVKKTQIIESVIPQHKIESEVVGSLIVPSKAVKVVNNDLKNTPRIDLEKTNVPLVSSSPVDIGKPTTEKKSTVTETQKASNDVVHSTGFSQVDGIDYVNNEYLENQEFNLDGKKRFYSMPDGTGRMETIERKKGVSRSVLDKLLNRSQQTTAPIVLSSSYVRLSSEDLKAAFENDRCFLDGYKKTIKTLSLKKDIGLWPRKPLKEKFEYDLVKLDPSIQYMQIDSYASSNEKPVYYWPLVVFLDEKGCIEEGVSGFKNTKTVGTVLQHSALQGVIKIPKDVRYIMMTPLASAVDVSEQELSNQGQIKISVLQ
ncbi:putative pilus assembly protein FilE [Acinetobacter sp. TUM15071]|uniref:putative pilus assembly protein FilE n=1 Tax=Acinetobacter sp. TUM15071 TaxID=2609135 RepID=UPI00124F1595|nr:putative pilus assembly protein FilE [Acinetobacter sp. TUM15071]